MNTTAAAAKANRTRATIRTWCRKGVVTATKQHGKWVIDEASLDYRISLDTPKARPVVYSVETMTAIGGNRWTKAGKDRVYLNDWEQYTGLETSHYKSGNISSAALDGRGIANGRVGRILGTVSKVYFDATDGRLHVQHYGADAVEVRYLDGDRETINLIKRINAGVRTAIAAL